MSVQMELEGTPHAKLMQLTNMTRPCGGFIIIKTKVWDEVYVGRVVELIEYQLIKEGCSP